MLPTRSAGLTRLTAFTPLMGRAYADGRNHDPGPGKPGSVSALSPYIRHRLITEQEVVAAAMAAHGAEIADKFIQEVFWRSYWKGWLAQRPVLPAPPRADGLCKTNSPASAGLFAFTAAKRDRNTLIRTCLRTEIARLHGRPSLHSLVQSTRFEGDSP